MIEQFAVDDHVSWNSEAGPVSGRIIDIHATEFDFKYHARHASSERPRYEIISDTKDHVAAHQGSVLKLIP